MTSPGAEFAQRNNCPPEFAQSANSIAIAASRQLLGFGLRASGFGLRASGFGLRASGFGLRASGFGHNYTNMLTL
ncbi:MAG: hypothetical protein LBL31_07095, partial [Spirochaetaceae bacterium]|nr:hypothetical protein [Spirochaetaceae bacterium]